MHGLPTSSALFYSVSSCASKLHGTDNGSQTDEYSKLPHGIMIFFGSSYLQGLTAVTRRRCAGWKSVILTDSRKMALYGSILALTMGLNLKHAIAAVSP